MPAAETIDQVIDQLDRIIQQSRTDGDRSGFFPALYRKVTLRVKEGIEQGQFDDGPRMERLDVRFANRYLEAYDAFHADGSCSAAWRLAFEAASRWQPVVLQHLLLGMNAHINLDLGVAAAQTVPEEALPGFEPDFHRINDILNELTNGVQRELAAVWPWLHLIDFFAGKGDELLARFGIGVTRDKAWRIARRLAGLNDGEREAAIRELDEEVCQFGKLVLHPPLPNLRLFLLIVRLGERKSVPDVIQLLQ